MVKTLFPYSMLLAAALCVSLFFACTSNIDEPRNFTAQSSSSAASSSSSYRSSSSSSIPVASNCSLNGGTVNIGGQVWMAENLNCNVSGSKCYDKQESNCATYGRLYDWSTAMALSSDCNSTSCSSQINTPHQGICPSGWHIPNDNEWDALMNAVGGSSVAGRYLKATSGWSSGGNGEDTYEFSALPGGIGGSDGSFDDVGYYGDWWSASEFNSYDAYNRYMTYNGEYVHYTNINKSYLLSVRCLPD